MAIALTQISLQSGMYSKIRNVQNKKVMQKSHLYVILVCTAFLSKYKNI